MSEETTIETDAPVIDGAIEAAPEVDAIPDAPKRRRGRPPKNNAQRDVNGLARQIFGLHTLAAMATGIPEAAISEQESAMLATALDSVADQYGLSLDGDRK